MTLASLQKLYEHYVATGMDEAAADVKAAMDRKPQPAPVVKKTVSKKS